MGLIRIDYDEAIREANRLDNMANDCRTINTMVRRLSTLLLDNWQGDAARAYVDKLEEFIRENNSIAGETENLSNTVRRVAREIREAERRALAAIKGE